MKLYIIFDTKGCGRLVGVFDKKEHAEEVVSVEPNYYKMYACDLNRVNPRALSWLETDDKKALLEKLDRHLEEQG